MLTQNRGFTDFDVEYGTPPWRAYGEAVANTTPRYSETMARLWRGYGEYNTSLWRGYGEAMAVPYSR